MKDPRWKINMYWKLWQRWTIVCHSGGMPLTSPGKMSIKSNEIVQFLFLSRNILPCTTLLNHMALRHWFQLQLRWDICFGSPAHSYPSQLSTHRTPSLLVNFIVFYDYWSFCVYRIWCCNSRSQWLDLMKNDSFPSSIPLKRIQRELHGECKNEKNTEKRKRYLHGILELKGGREREKKWENMKKHMIQLFFQLLASCWWCHVTGENHHRLA